VTGPESGRPHVVVFGPSTLTRDVIEGAIAEAGMDVIDLRDNGHSTVDVALLVDPDSHDWDNASHSADRIVLVSPDPVDGPTLTDAIQRGAEAVVDLDEGVAHLVRTIREVTRQGTSLTARQTRVLVEAVRGGAADRRPAPSLSGREVEVLESIARGESLKQTARVLGISVKTVENVQSRLYLKLGVRTRAQAVAQAHALGLLTIAIRQD